MQFSQARPEFSPVTIVIDSELEVKMIVAALSHSADQDAETYEALFAALPTPSQEETLWGLRQRLMDCLPKE